MTGFFDGIKDGIILRKPRSGCLEGRTAGCFRVINGPCRTRSHLALSDRSDARLGRRVASQYRAGVDFRLWLADVEPGAALRRGASGAGSRLPPQLLPVFAGISRDAGKAGAGSRA